MNKIPDQFQSEICFDAGWHAITPYLFKKGESIGWWAECGWFWMEYVH